MSLAGKAPFGCSLLWSQLPKPGLLEASQTYRPGRRPDASSVTRHRHCLTRPSQASLSIQLYSLFRPSSPAMCAGTFTHTRTHTHAHTHTVKLVRTDSAAPGLCCGPHVSQVRLSSIGRQQHPMASVA
ncbi:unnamed protein product [Protopolystoma xenopodis]|uniref:Uncharacterized protein n=1 Tax=Protopolystoma xenopodis TaxID=117903 RepID=A0A3S5FE60_9PLAT|nr:unnamed protein product [Protopolystoma xenopodis]